MNSSRPILICLAFSIWLVSGCYVPNKMYRAPKESLVQVPPAPPHFPSAPSPEGAACTSDSLRGRPCLAFLEFDDMGEKWSQNSQPISDDNDIDNASQLSNAVKIIRLAAKQDPHALIITFIHGWKHNADTDDSNIEGFKQVLNYLFKHYYDTANHRYRPVIGVYISWRGNLVSQHWPVRQQFTYFNREATAARIPGPSLTDALLRMTEAAHESTDPDNHPLVVLVGHSFGGLLLERGFAQATVDEIKVQAHILLRAEGRLHQNGDALADALGAIPGSSPSLDRARTKARELLFAISRPGGYAAEQKAIMQDAGNVATLLEQARREAGTGDEAALDRAVHQANAVVNALTDCQRSAFTPPADLVIFVNSAAAATEAKETLDFFASDHFEYTVDGKRTPLFLSVSSSADAATKFAMPIGHGLSFLNYKSEGSFRYGSTPGDEHADGYQLTCFEPRTGASSFLKPAPTQGAFFMSTAAHMQILQSHQLEEVNDPDKRESCRTADFPDQPSLVTTYKMDDAARCFKVEERNNRCNGTPYWLMEIDPSIVPDHGTIFTARFLTFLTLFIPTEVQLTKNVKPTLSVHR